MARRRGLDDTGGKRCPRPLAEPHAERQKRRLAKLLDRLQMAGLARYMADQAVVERRRIGSLENCRGSRHHIAVEQDRDLLDAGGENGARHRRDFPPAETAKHFERIVEMGLVGFEDRKRTRLNYSP